MTLELTRDQRMLLVHRVLPKESGSIREAIALARLRKRLDLSDAEREASGFHVTPMGTVGWTGPLDPVEYTLTDAEVSVVAGGLLLMETQGSVPTSDDAVALYEMFADALETEESEIERTTPEPVAEPTPAEPATNGVHA